MMKQNWEVKNAADKQRKVETREARKNSLIIDTIALTAMNKRRDSSVSRREVGFFCFAKNAIYFYILSRQDYERRRSRKIY